MKYFLPSTSISRFLFTPKPQHPHLPPTPFFHILHFSTSHPYRRNDEEIRHVRVSVWWNFENCCLPTNVNVYKVAQFITTAVRANGIKGPVSITAFGDVLQLSRDNQKAISDTGISLTHIPNGGKNGADRSLLVDLMYWVSQNPPPAHLFLITGDRDFASVLHRLRMSNYNILLASSDNAPGVLCSSASIMWEWSALVRGENLTGKIFNQPPDGPYASWYGRYNAPLLDPFSAVGQPIQPSNMRVDEVSECGPDKLPAIPDTVMKQIRNILNSYPKGVPAVDLRAKLAKSNVSIDKSYFGYRKFYRFLLAMPQILKLKADTSGQCIVHGIPTEIYGENESTTRSSVGPLGTKDEGQSSSNTVKPNGLKCSSKELADVKPLQRLVSEPKVHELPKPYTEEVNEKLSPPLSGLRIVETRKMQDRRKSQEPNEDAHETTRVVQEASQVQMVGTPTMKDCRKSQEPIEHAQEKLCGVQEADKKEVTNSDLLTTDDHSSISKSSVFEKISKWWFGSENSVWNAKYCTVVNTTSGPGMNTKEKKEVNFAGNSEATLDNSAQTSSLFKKVPWFRRSFEKSDDVSSEKSQNPESSSHILFSKDAFWNDMKAFLNTPKGSSLVLKAKTRSQMGQALERDGPRGLTSLSDDELLQLVNMLISDKKWVEESASLSSPFKLAEIAPQDAPDGDARSSKFSNSVISDMQLQSGSLGRHQLNGEKKCQARPHAGFAQPAVQKLGNKSRSEVLADIKNLLRYIVKAHPNGYTIRLFEKLFLDKYGYPLEFRNLGYPKLGTLLQIMPGINIESGLIMASGKGLHASGRIDLEEPSYKLSEEPQKDERNESPSEKFGPLASAVSDEEPTKSKAKENMSGQIQHICELLSDDDLSDSSEDETTLSTKTGSREQKKGREGVNSLSSILDSFHGIKEGSIKTSNPEIVDSSDEYVEDGTSAAFRSRKSGGTDMPVHGRQKRPAESYYSSVPDQQGNEGKLIDTLRSMMKPGEK